MAAILMDVKKQNVFQEKQVCLKNGVFKKRRGIQIDSMIHACFPTWGSDNVS